MNVRDCERLECAASTAFSISQRHLLHLIANSEKDRPRQRILILAKFKLNFVGRKHLSPSNFNLNLLNTVLKSV